MKTARILVIACVLLGVFAVEVNALTLRNHTTCGHVPTGKIEIIDTSQFQETDRTITEEQKEKKNNNFMGNNDSKDDKTVDTAATATTPQPSPASDQDKARNLAASTIRFSYDYSSLKWQNTDMVFYLRTKTDSATWIAAASACQLQVVDNRPVAGVIQFNTKYLLNEYNNFQFQDLVHIITHEVFHALAFSSSLFQYYKNGGYTSGTHYDSNSIPSWIAFPNVLAWAKTQYACSSLTQYKLENNGGASSAGSHWERTILANDIMTSSDVTGDGVWSCVNNALMKDTNWYTVDDTFCEVSQWGLNKSCNFLTQMCAQSPMGSEFCDPSSTTSSRAGFFNTGYGTCSTTADPYTNNSCAYVMTYAETVCYNTNNNSISTTSQLVNSGSVYGWDSKGFQSTLVKSGYTYTSPWATSQLAICYKYACNGGGTAITVYVGSNTLVCSSDGQTLTLSGYNGSLKCPTISDFCTKQYNCNNLCNSGGFCLKQTCYCTPGFSGTNCVCGNGTYWNGQTCATCSTSNCRLCTVSDVCIACKVGYVLNGSSCSTAGHITPSFVGLIIAIVCLEILRFIQ